MGTPLTTSLPKLSVRMDGSHESALSVWYTGEVNYPLSFPLGVSLTAVLSTCRVEIEIIRVIRHNLHLVLSSRG